MRSWNSPPVDLGGSNSPISGAVSSSRSSRISHKVPEFSFPVRLPYLTNSLERRLHPAPLPGREWIYRRHLRLIARLDEVGDALGNHHCGDVGVGAHYVGHYRGVGDAEAGDAAHTQLLVNDGHRVAGWPHLAGAGDVVGGADVAAQPGVQRLVGLQVGWCGSGYLFDEAFIGAVLQQRTRRGGRSPAVAPGPSPLAGSGSPCWAAYAGRRTPASTRPVPPPGTGRS